MANPVVRITFNPGRQFCASWARARPECLYKEQRSDFDGIFTRDRPVIFAYHGYPYLIHRLTYNRTNHAGMHVRGFKEEGTTTTPFDMVVLNELDRFHLAIEVIERVPGLGIAAAHIKQQFRDALIEHSHYVREHGEDMPQIRNWVWPSSAAGQTAAPAGD